MAIDQTATRSKSMTSSTHSFDSVLPDKITQIFDASGRVSHLVARKHRIERWAFKGRSASITDSSVAASAALGMSPGQKHSERSYSQIGRKLDLHLLQLSEQRQKVIERRNFDQKLFANKQALKHKDNPAVHK